MNNYCANKWYSWCNERNVVCKNVRSNENLFTCWSVLGCDDNSTGAIFHTIEHLNSLKFNGLPNHKLNLKVGAPMMLLRNLNQFNGLCNETRLVIKQMGNKALQVEVLTGSSMGDKVLIPWLLLSPLDTEWLFKLKRRQFSVSLALTLTINKSQGQTIKKVDLYLPKSIFTHGQLYVAVSRTTSKFRLKILLYEKSHKKEVIQEMWFTKKYCARRTTKLCQRKAFKEETQILHAI